MSIGEQKGGMSSNTRLQAQLMSSSLGLNTVLGTARDVRGIFTIVMTGLEELQQDMTKIVDRVEERARQDHERLRDELKDAKLRVKSDQAQLIQNTDQCLAERFAQLPGSVKKETAECYGRSSNC